MSPEFLDSVVTFLGSNGFGSPGIDLLAGIVPSTPYTVTAVLPTGGYSSPRDPTRKPSVQFVHRDTQVNSGLAYVSRLAAFLDDSSNRLCAFPGIWNAMNDPGLYYLDNNGHKVFTLNYVYLTTKL